MDVDEARWLRLDRGPRETLRAALLGTPTHHHSAVLAIAWSAGLGLIGYLWAKRLFNRDPTP